MKPIRLDGCKKAEVIQVIRVTSVRGAGTPEDPIRELIEFWSLEGYLLAQNDAINDEF